MCARQAQQAQLGMYWSNQLPPISSVLCYPKPFEVCMKGGEVSQHDMAPCRITGKQDSQSIALNLARLAIHTSNAHMQLIS